MSASLPLSNLRRSTQSAQLIDSGIHYLPSGRWSNITSASTTLCPVSAAGTATTPVDGLSQSHEVRMNARDPHTLRTIELSVRP